MHKGKESNQVHNKFLFPIFTNSVTGTVVAQHFLFLSGDQRGYFIQGTLGVKCQVAHVTPEDEPEMEDITICHD